MRTVVAHALAWPQRVQAGVERLNLARHGRLDFEEPDRKRFPCLDLAYQALRAGGGAPCLLNAANETAVAAFLDRRLPFTGIPDLIRHVLDAEDAGQVQDLPTILASDARARRRAEAWIADRGR
jgi:1-deoxy-D-xylulose-5-phosphate reductoisomerase